MKKFASLNTDRYICDRGNYRCAEIRAELHEKKGHSNAQSKYARHATRTNGHAHCLTHQPFHVFRHIPRQKNNIMRPIGIQTSDGRAPIKDFLIFSHSFGQRLSRQHPPMAATLPQMSAHFATYSDLERASIDCKCSIGPSSQGNS